MRTEDLHVLSVGKAIKILPRDLILQHLQLPDPVKQLLCIPVARRIQDPWPLS